MFNHQLALDTAVRGIIAQGKLAKGCSGTCYYRGNDGAKCGVGHLIPDDRYRDNIEGLGVTSLSPDELRAVIDPTLGEPDENFLHRLQQAHDDASDVAEFIEGAAFLARHYNLEMPQ